jgi:cytochrome c-type biogenesis protein
MTATIVVAFLAGLVSTLSPCVLPLLPIVVAAAAGTHRLGPVALAAGVALSFVAIGMFVATIGFAIGLDGSVFRLAGAAVLIALGAVLLVPRFQQSLATAAGPISAWGDRTFGGFDTSGLGGQFALGLLLGLVWSPCVGPTLGAASVLASQGKDLGAVALTMTAFGVGAAVPLLALGLLSRETMLAWRGRLMDTGKSGKLVLGVVLLSLGVLIATGADKRIEAALVAISPQWLTELTTRY